MKFLITIMSICVLFNKAKAQETIKVGDEKTITCTGSFINEVQHYFDVNKPSSKGRSFVDNQKDSLVFFTAYIDGGSSHTVFRYSIAKKDIDKEDGLVTGATRENGVSFNMIYIKSIDLNSVIITEKHSGGEVEKYDPLNTISLYFAADKEADAKQWLEKIKELIK